MVFYSKLFSFVFLNVLLESPQLISFVYQNKKSPLLLTNERHCSTSISPPRSSSLTIFFYDSNLHNESGSSPFSNFQPFNLLLSGITLIFPSFPSILYINFIVNNDDDDVYSTLQFRNLILIFFFLNLGLLYLEYVSSLVGIVLG